MKKIIILVVAFMAFGDVTADHIVGGELEFTTLRAGLYRIKLIQYRDEVQTNNEVVVNRYVVYMFSAKDDALVFRDTLVRRAYEEVSYTKPECAIDELETSRVIWYQDFELDPEEYADPEGYYIVWERCCRNAAIKNIVSPLSTGMKYVVEIPPLWKDGRPFINSSPELLKPLSDYACVNQLYYTEFTGEDRDGDSLVYRLATPLNSSVFAALPIPQSKPHFPVNFATGYSLTNTIPGNPPLRISQKGLLTVSPRSTGLYVFSVIVEEWRRGQKIGYVQRDFQMLVVDGCEPPDPPDVGVKIPGNDAFDPKVDVLEYTLSDDKCFDFFVTNIKQGRTISLRAEGVNFDGDLDEVFAFTSSYIDDDRDTLLVEVCMPGCPPVRNAPFIVDLIAGDDACPLPQLDTARLMIQVEPPPNVFPTVTDLNPSYLVPEGNELTLNIISDDGDGDRIDAVILLEDDLDAGELGISFETTLSTPGHLEGVFRWNADCLVNNFSYVQKFRVGIQMEDRDTCMVENPNIEWVELRLGVPPNLSPSVQMDSDPILTIEVGDTIQPFNVRASDLDFDLVELFLEIEGPNSRTQAGAKFNSAIGVGAAESDFSWIADCEFLEINENTRYSFYFIAEDRDKCRIQNRDTLELLVNVIVPVNNKPEFNLPMQNIAIEVGKPFEMDITALDIDPRDSLTLSFFDQARLPESPSLQFETVTGRGEVSSTLKWMPECELLDFGETSTTYELSFLVFDDRCPEQELETITMNVEVFETREEFMGFDPPNVFTPNGDGKNDVFTLTNQEVPQYNLPSDNCDDTFETIRIFDRNGHTVFESSNREFIWEGANVADGTYYYLIQFSKTPYRGYLQVMR